MGNVQCIDWDWENCCDDELLGGSEKDKENSSFVCLLNVLRRKGADTFQNGKFTLFPPRHTVAKREIYPTECHMFSLQNPCI